MWVKLTTIEQLESLHEGAMIAIYPLHGAPQPTFDDASHDYATQRLLSENDTEAKVIHTTPLQRKEDAYTVTTARMGDMLLGTGYISYIDIIEQGIWWVQEAY